LLSLPPTARVLLLRVLAALVPVGVVYVMLQLGRWSDWVPSGEITQLTRTRAFEGLPSLSPDGQYVAYRSDANGTGDILLSRLETWETVNLTPGSPDDETDPAFSPDGDSIAFASAQSGIAIVPRTGGPPRHLARDGANPAWTPDGRFLVYSVERNIGSDFRSASEGWKVDVATGRATRISVADFHQPAVSPHGSRIAYSGRSVDRTNRGRITGAREHIWTMPLDASGGGEPLRLTTDAANESSPLWSPDGRFLYFVSNRTGPSAIWRVRIDERTGQIRGVPVIVPTPFSQPARLTRSADGQTMIWSDARPIRRALRIDFDEDARKTRGAPAEVVQGEGTWETAEPSPNESQFVLTTTDGHLYLGDPGGDVRPLTDGQVLDRHPRWSPDGEWIAFQSNRGGSAGVWFIKPGGGRLRQLPWASGELLYPVWSPDAQQLAVWDSSLAGCRILRTDDEAGAAEVLPSIAQGGFIPADWSPDGKLIAGTVSGSVWIYSMSSRSYQQLKPGSNPVWLADSRRLLYAYGGRLFIGDAVLRISRELFSMPDQQLDAPRLSRDNRHVYFTGGGTDANLWVMRLSSS
jgi:Tol biopolymer transport system component